MNHTQYIKNYDTKPNIQTSEFGEFLISYLDSLRACKNSEGKFEIRGILPCIMDGYKWQEECFYNLDLLGFRVSLYPLMIRIELRRNNSFFYRIDYPYMPMEPKLIEPKLSIDFKTVEYLEKDITYQVIESQIRLADLIMRDLASSQLLRLSF